MTTTEPKPATRTPPNLERAIQAVAEELHDGAATLADFAINLSRDLPRSQQYALLQRLVEIGRQMHRTLGQLCNATPPVGRLFIGDYALETASHDDGRIEVRRWRVTDPRDGQFWLCLACFRQLRG